MHMYNPLYSRKPGILLPYLQQHHHRHLTPYRSSLRCIIGFLRRLHPSLFRVVEFVPESSPISPLPPKTPTHIEIEDAYFSMAQFMSKYAPANGGTT